jgi:hypothetical protein
MACFLTSIIILVISLVGMLIFENAYNDGEKVIFGISAVLFLISAVSLLVELLMIIWTNVNYAV